MNVPRSTPNWILAVIAIGATLYWLRPILAPFALALVLWLAIDSLARWVMRRVPGAPGWLALTCSLLIILGACCLVVWVFAENVGAVAANVSEVQPRLDALAVQAQQALRVGGPPWSVRGAILQLEPAALLSGVAAAAQSLVANAGLIGLYLFFLFPAAAAAQYKLPSLVPDPNNRRRTQRLMDSIRTSIERYFQVQTTMSLLTSTLSFATLWALHLPNALFWSFLIFFLNFIPNIGSVIAVLLPTLFAATVSDDWRYIAIVAVGLHTWQFVIGTFVQPRVTGASVNLSTIVVVISLALWGMIWGVIGVFLAVPLTVMLMIVLEQFPGTHWIAVLLSANGRPAFMSEEGAEAPSARSAAP